MHPTYNKTAYPVFVCNHGNWDIYRNDRGYCVAIPTDQAARQGCRASHFGDRGYTQATLGIRILLDGESAS